ncbi:hypothetical protein RhiirA5_486183 [Rhizophagus irregularis]|uniref:DUF7431 domain-containing protein n=1 Tax=Rhizophagus irregularis TaxID=588596 RepID=A0A2N0Q8I3_9GLOM|nr:hypothetical protein RhiirA5_486183 [Rhizophagus irregularis]
MSFKLNHFSNNAKKITIKIINSPTQKLEPVLLNPTDKLSTIRQKLEKNYKQFKFLKFSENDGSYKFTEIKSEFEGQHSLSYIIDKNILYIECEIKTNIDWNCLIEKCELNNGCTMTFDGIKKADKNAFVIKNCELKEIGAERYKMHKDTFKSTKEWMKITNLFFTTDIDVLENFIKLGMSIEITENKKSNIGISGSYDFVKHEKASLKFGDHLQPTQEFIGEVEKAIESEDPVKVLKQITKQYGQFIPTEVILGGRAHFNEHITFKEITMNVASASNNSTKLIGGKQPNNIENFDEGAWFKSLNDHNYWDCIEYRNPVSIFQPLSENLRKQIIKYVGKRILYSKTQGIKYHLENHGEAKKHELKDLPLNILKMIQNKEADCNIFATVTDMTELKDDFFTCQVLCSSSCSSLPPCPASSCSCPPSKPSLLIHCVQNKFKKRECNLRIKWMVVGYYTDFNFILSDFNVHLKIFENKITSDRQTMIYTLNYNYDPYISPCFGIPVLTELTSSNKSIVIGHHFFNARKENKIGAYTFSYCSKENNRVELKSHNFTFFTFIISDYCTSNTYNTFSFKHPIMKKPYIKLNNDVAGSPKFISLYSAQKTIRELAFLNQNCKKITLVSISGYSIVINLLTSKDYFECLSFDLCIPADNEF